MKYRCIINEHLEKEICLIKNGKNTSSINSVSYCKLQIRVLGMRKNARKMEISELWFFSRLLRVSWSDNRTNSWVLEVHETILNTIERRKLKWQELIVWVKISWWACFILKERTVNPRLDFQTTSKN